MRFVPRPMTPPAALSAPEFARMRQEYLEFLSLSPERRRQTRPPDRHLPNSPGLKAALDDLFLGKCAFCEQRVATRPYRFRPTSFAEPGASSSPESALYYGWLADSWENLYQICYYCLPQGQNFFPVEGSRQGLPSTAAYSRYVRENTGAWRVSDLFPMPENERPLLLDPCGQDDISRHLGAALNGAFVARSPTGQTTLQHFKLNRGKLKAARAKQAKELLEKLKRIPRDVGLELDLQRLVPDTHEFAGFLRLLVEDWRSGRRTPVTATTTDPIDSLPADPAPALRRVSISGFKALEALSFDMPQREAPEDPVPSLLILGENAAGKSSILEAMALTLTSDAAASLIATEPERLLLDPTQMGQDRQRRSRAEVRVDFADGSFRSLVLTAKGLTHQGETALPIFAYGAYRHFLNDHRDWSPERGILSLFRSDNLLSNPETWLKSLEPARFDEVVAALRSIFGTAAAFDHIERDPEKGCIVVTKPEGPPEGPDGPQMRTPLTAVSSGFRTVLALSCDVMRWLIDPDRGRGVQTLALAQGIVLIDEIEAHLHPRWKVEIMDGLRRALPQVTFIVTTHDPLCLRGMRPGEVMVLRRVPQSGEGELPVRIEQLDRLPDVTNLTIEQLLKSDFFALFDTDDPRRGHSMARLADALTRGNDPELVELFRAEVTEALPIGRSEVSMLVQEAVADYIREQGRLLQDDRRKLRDRTRQRILAILRTGQDDAAG